MSRKRADILLVERGFFDSRAKARAAIEAGGVIAGGRPVAKPSDLIDEAAEIAAEPAHPWVGRGALKLAHALELWPVRLEGRVVLDVGASTGGFTEVCLQRGAARVYAVDVGRDQLHPKIAGDPRVVDLSGIDARDLDGTLVREAPQLVVSDVSFIGLAKALPVALSLAAPGADLIALVKPQFEVGREHIGKGGLVKDEAARERAVTDVAAFLESSGWSVQGRTQSLVTGGDGNVEYLLWAKKRPPARVGCADGLRATRLRP
jgi:23S rRNA (cytidine1920-2'-O)/16S rRNA (cytidine1409-2'-O)-methyltransferase